MLNNMKPIIKATTIALTVLVIACQTTDKNIPISSINNYFVKSSFKVDKDGNFLQINDFESFNAIFGSATTMKERTWIQANDFKDKMVLAVIKDFKNNLYNLQIVNIKLEGGELRVDYEFLLKENNLTYTSTGSSIVQIEKLKYKSINYYENGKLIKELPRTN
jgi:hypothetical protein